MKVEGYYEQFPPSSYGVSIQTRGTTTGGVPRKVVISEKDYHAGDVIYEEPAVVSVLDLDVQNAGTHCSRCFRAVEPSQAIKLKDDPLACVFCSSDCESAFKSQSQNLLFSVEPVLPAAVSPEPITPKSLDERRRAQAKYTEYIKSQEGPSKLLTARFIARQIIHETLKLMPGAEKNSGKPTFAGEELPDYTLADHLERLRYIERTASAEDKNLLADVLRTALSGLEQFLVEDRLSILFGKMAYNAYGVCFGEGRDRPVSKLRPEDVERTRTPYGTNKQIGTAFYTLSSYLLHSCKPNALPSFSHGTNTLRLVASCDIKKGDEIFVAFIDVAQHPDETITECRRRRRIELARGWKFACNCERCEEEGKDENGSDDGLSQKDESKVETSLSNFENLHAMASPSTDP